jgi:hypothetical protein
MTAILGKFLATGAMLSFIGFMAAWARSRY